MRPIEQGPDQSRHDHFSRGFLAIRANAATNVVETFNQSSPTAFRAHRADSACCLEGLLTGITNKVRCEIDVGALLLRLVDPHPLRWRHASQPHRHGVSQEVTVRDREIRNGSKRAKVNLLVGRPAWVPRPGADSSRVAVDRDHTIVRQHVCTQRAEAEPLVGRSFEATVVQVESIYIDDDIGHSQPDLPAELTCSGRPSTPAFIDPPSSFGMRVRNRPQGRFQCFWGLPALLRLRVRDA